MLVDNRNYRRETGPSNNNSTSANMVVEVELPVENSTFKWRLNKCIVS